MLNSQVLLLVLLATIGHVISGLSPIVIVPGWSDSRLEVRISDGSSCDTGGEWVLFWYNPDISIECIEKALELQYDEVANTYSNSTGAEVRVAAAEFGDIVAVEYYDENKTLGNYNKFIEYFVMKGYVKDETIRAAPYDWRLAVDSLEKIGYYQSLKTLVEEMYNTDNEKVSIVVHSMGGPVALYFFNNIVTQDWKDKYINVFVPLAAAWGGFSDGIIYFITAKMPEIGGKRELSSPTMQSMAWLLPNPVVWKDRVIITINDSSYTANDYKELFAEIPGRENDYIKINRIQPVLGDIPPPNVPTYCLYGVGLPTTEVVNYGSGFPENIVSITKGDGDGAVDTISLEVCLKWSSQTQTFKAKVFDKADHVDVITSSTVLDVVAEAILNQTMEETGDGFRVTEFKFLVALLVIVALMIAIL